MYVPRTGITPQDAVQFAIRYPDGKSSEKNIPNCGSEIDSTVTIDICWAHRFIHQWFYSSELKYQDFLCYHICVSCTQSSKSPASIADFWMFKRLLIRQHQHFTYRTFCVVEIVYRHWCTAIIRPDNKIIFRNFHSEYSQNLIILRVF